MKDLILIILFCALILCVILFFIYFSFLFKHILSMKRSADFMNQMQMHPLQLERFSVSEADDFETETTSVCIPNPNPTIQNIATVAERPERPIIKRNCSSFFQLPLDSYYKFSLVDEDDGSVSETELSRKGSKSKFKGRDNGFAKMIKRPETLSSNGIEASRRKNTWENIMEHYLSNHNVESQTKIFYYKEKFQDVIYSKLPSIEEKKEYLI